MHPHLAIASNFPLQTLNTFGIAAHAHAYLRIESLADLPLSCAGFLSLSLYNRAK